MWFSISLAKDPIIQHGGLNYTCVAETVAKIKDKGFNVIHLISIGGWNTRHPDASITGQQAYQSWKEWNTKTIANSEFEFNGFDGFDWDLEGNDDQISSPYNHFSVETLDIMGHMSVLAKADGYVVAMAPAESYIDFTHGYFDRSLLHSYLEYKPYINFTYHGWNCYAYVWSKFQFTILNDGVIKRTFDWVFVQFYEGYSHMFYNTTFLRQTPASYMVNAISTLNDGYIVHFSNDHAIKYQTQVVRIPYSYVVIGLANGWADNNKFMLLSEEQLFESGELMKAKKLIPRGFGFWNIADEGRFYNGTSVKYWLAKILSKVNGILSSSA